LKGDTGFIILLELHLYKTECKSCLDPLGCSRIRRDELLQLFQGEVVQLVVVEIDRQLEISVFFGVLRERRVYRDEQGRGEDGKQQMTNAFHGCTIVAPLAYVLSPRCVLSVINYE